VTAERGWVTNMKSGQANEADSDDLIDMTNFLVACKMTKNKLGHWSFMIGNGQYKWKTCRNS
jgi:hypothetical protein